VFLFTADLGVPKLLRLKEARKTPFFNGALECRLFRFDMVAGFNRREAAKPKVATRRAPAPYGVSPAIAAWE
jgi:putative N6-adenine-specific DNA methylase